MLPTPWQKPVLICCINSCTAPIIALLHHHRRSLTSTRCALIVILLVIYIFFSSFNNVDPSHMILVDCRVLCCRVCGPIVAVWRWRPPWSIDRGLHLTYGSFFSRTQITSPPNPSFTTKPTTYLTKISPPKIPGQLGSQVTELIPITFLTLSTAYFSW